MCSPVAAARRSRTSRRSVPHAPTRSSTSSRPAPAVAGKPTTRLVRDPPAERQAAHELPPRSRPAHRRAPDLRPARSGDDRARASAGRGGRDDQRRRSRSREPGPYRVVVDAYPNTTGPQRNFQLFGSLRVAGAYHPAALPPFAPSVVADGYRFTIAGRPSLHAIQAGFLTFTSPTRRGSRRASRRGSARSRTRSSSGAGRSTTSTRTSARPAQPAARARSGRPRSPAARRPPASSTSACSFPCPATWRLFLQCRVDGPRPHRAVHPPASAMNEGDNLHHEKNACRRHARRAHGAGRRERRVRTRRDQPPSRGWRSDCSSSRSRRRQRSQAHDDADRAHGACRVRHRLVRAVARLEAHRCNRRAAATRP